MENFDSQELVKNVATELLVAQFVGFLGSFSQAFLLYVSFWTWSRFLYISLFLNFSIVLIPLYISMKELSREVLRQDKSILEFSVLAVVSCSVLINSALWSIYKIAQHRNKDGRTNLFHTFCRKLLRNLFKSGFIPIASTLLLLDTLDVVRPKLRVDNWAMVNIAFMSVLLLRGLFETYCYWEYRRVWKVFKTYTQEKNVEKLKEYPSYWNRNFVAKGCDKFLFPIFSVIGVYAVPSKDSIEARTFFAVIWTLSLSAVMLTIESYILGQWYYEAAHDHAQTITYVQNDAKNDIEDLAEQKLAKLEA